MCRLVTPVVFVVLFSPIGLSTAQESPPRASKTWQRIQQQGFFTVSLDPDNLPYSAREGELQGMEVELAHAVAKQLGLAAKIDWIQVRSETSLARLLEGDSDVVIGLPVEERLRNDDESVAERIVYTRPYHRTGYLIFARKDGPRVERLSNLHGEQTRRVGAQAGTLADVLLKRQGFRRQLYGTQQATLRALAEKQIDYAYLWSNATWLARSSPQLEVEIVQPYKLVDGREMAAVVRRGDKDFREQLNGALDRLVENAFVERLLRRYGMPYYPPDSGDESASSNVSSTSKQ